jgi:hypothetical protein
MSSSIWYSSRDLLNGAPPQYEGAWLDAVWGFFSRNHRFGREYQLKPHAPSSVRTRSVSVVMNCICIGERPPLIAPAYCQDTLIF